MSITYLSVNAFLLVVPGLLALILIQAFVPHRPFRVHEYIVYSILLAMLSHAAGFGLSQLICYTGYVFPDTIEDKRVLFNWGTLALNMVAAVLVGILASYIMNYKFLHWVGRKLRFSWEYADPDLWHFTMNADQPNWVVIRNKEEDIMYLGWVRAWSGPSEPKALFLQDVEVFRNSDAELLFSVPSLYIEFKDEAEIILEFVHSKDFQRTTRNVSDS